MSALQPTTATVVHHHHYYGQTPAQAPQRPAPSLRRPTSPACRSAGPSPAVYVGLGAAIAVAVVVATAVATVLAVVGGLVVLLVLGARHYAAIEREHRPVPASPARRDARGRFTA